MSSESNASAQDFFTLTLTLTLTIARAGSYEREEGIRTTMAARTKTNAAENKQ
jgi:hypothetical protein